MSRAEAADAWRSDHNSIVPESDSQGDWRLGVRYRAQRRTASSSAIGAVWMSITKAALTQPHRQSQVVPQSSSRKLLLRLIDFSIRIMM
jgi:hypothetical protein